MKYRGMKDVLDFFTSRERIFKFFDNRHWLDWLPDETYMKLAFRSRMGYPLDLKDTKTFSEKLQWLKLHDRNPLYTTLVDKYAVRGYVADKIGEEHLIPLAVSYTHLVRPDSGEGQIWGQRHYPRPHRLGSGQRPGRAGDRGEGPAGRGVCKTSQLCAGCEDIFHDLL